MAAEQTAQAVASGPPAESFIESLIKMWEQGGWTMYPLAALTLVIFFEGINLTFYLFRSGTAMAKRGAWVPWIADPSKGHGHIGAVIGYVMLARDRAGLRSRVEAVRMRTIPGVNQRIIFLGVLVTIAPLMGLLGTVLGMLKTFLGLSASAAGGQTVDTIAQGISEALITTQTGLVIAIPGYIILAIVIHMRNTYTSFLAKLESNAMQHMSARQKAAA